MDTKEKIIQAALDEFAENGYHGTKIKNICAKVGLNQASVNYHFNTKEALYRLVIERVFSIPDPLEVAYANASPDEPPEKLFRLWLDTSLDFTTSSNPFLKYRYRIVMKEFLNPSPIFHEIVENKLKARFLKIKEIIRKIFPETENDAEIDVATLLSLAQIMFFFNKPVITALTGSNEFTEKNKLMITGQIIANLLKKASE